MFVSASPALSAGEIFRCVMKETRHVSESGQQVAYPRDIYVGDVILADTTTGLVRLFGLRKQFNIVQTASTGNGWILSQIEPGPGSTSVLLLVIKTYEKNVPFLFTNGMNIHSGNCEIVR
jgi:hypothetical protein